MIRSIAILAFTLLLACQQENPAADLGLAGYDPNKLETLQAACLKKGGRFGPGGASNAMVCFEDTRDANKSCSRASDCDGQCLARSMTCAPIKPLFGCHEVLTSLGARTTMCLE